MNLNVETIVGFSTSVKDQISYLVALSRYAWFRNIIDKKIPVEERHTTSSPNDEFDTTVMRKAFVMLSAHLDIIPNDGQETGTPHSATGESPSIGPEMDLRYMHAFRAAHLANEKAFLQAIRAVRIRDNQDWSEDEMLLQAMQLCCTRTAEAIFPAVLAHAEVAADEKEEKRQTEPKIAAARMGII